MTPRLTCEVTKHMKHISCLCSPHCAGIFGTLHLTEAGCLFDYLHMWAKILTCTSGCVACGDPGHLDASSLSEPSPCVFSLGNSLVQLPSAPSREFLAPYTTVPTRDSRMAPAHMAQGSRVTYNVASRKCHLPNCFAVACERGTPCLQHTLAGDGVCVDGTAQFAACQ